MDANYNLPDKLFHRLVLSPKITGELLFDLEKYLYLERCKDLRQGRSIFVCGLARAGTTILMRALFETGQLASLTYQDMPMVVAPNIWAKVSRPGQRNIESRERAHGDGIKTDNKSPEAFEEVFWRITESNQFVHSSGILSYVPSEQSMDEYQKYQALVCLRYNKSRYLSKNNNNIFRLEKLSQYLSSDVFLIPFRHPLSHAQSLLSQHRRFSNLSSFEFDYMTWLGHFEFGQTQKHYLFEKNTRYDSSPTELKYWAEVWINTYSTILAVINKGASNIIPICYEQLCENNRDYISAIGSKCELPEFLPTFSESSKGPESDIGSELQDRAEQLYEQLKDTGTRLLMGE